MPDMEKVIKGLECCASMDGNACRECPYSSECIDYEAIYQTGTAHLAADALALLKEQEVMSPDEFKNGLLKMFSSIWDCEVDHPVFQDTVGELMSAVMQLYARAVKRE